MFITRDQALDTLSDIIDSGILKKDLQDALEEVHNIIYDEEEYGVSLWGAEDEAIDLFVAKREDLITPEWEQHCKDLYEKYRIRTNDESAREVD